METKYFEISGIIYFFLKEKQNTFPLSPKYFK